MIVTLYHGDCLEVMPTLEENSIDAIVCDPPYGLSFMGKDWDHGVPGVAFWTEALRVAKPGAHLLAFGGTRTFHRLAVAIEDAGWEIRDTVMWVYGSGFPKSHDVSKAIDKAAGAEREVIGEYRGASPNRVVTMGRPEHSGSGWSDNGMVTVSAPATPEAAQWSGYGTALKPAWEPIIMARKPFRGSVAANMLEWGTGAINIDGCRVEYQGGQIERDFLNKRSGSSETTIWGQHERIKLEQSQVGRWPANLVHDGSDEVLALFPVQKSPKPYEKKYSGWQSEYVNGKIAKPIQSTESGDSGSAARFFYCAKASKADRDGSTHPTVKPSSLMRYLCRLVTQPGGIILDPFMGSGSTGKAAVLEGFSFVGMDQKAEYVDDARVRIENAQKQVDDASQQLSFSIGIE